ncbi:MAG TPA: SDR family oxidoreductase [Vicinamibacterales bacterium]|nr:SDR family oxidoreductase [Vicinamibacterales bacterium]
MDLQLAGKVAIVTGASRGLGFASANALVAEGCHVVMCARGADRLEQAAGELRVVAPAGTEIVAVTADVSTTDGVTKVVNAAVGKLGSIDVLVNNVGLAKGAGLLDTPDETWQEALDQTLFPTIRMSRAALPFLKQRGGGTIVIISSIFGREAGGRMAYNAVKAAELSLTKSLAQQLAKDQVRVVGVAPGSILFPGGSWHARQQADPEGIADFVRHELPFGRFGRPEEVGDVVAFLASLRASWVSGTTVVVDGAQSRMF